MRALGFTVDALVLGLSAYALWHHPLVTEMRTDGVMNVLSTLPSAVNATGMSGAAAVGGPAPVLVGLNRQLGVVEAPTAATLQQWFDYLLDDDIGPRGKAHFVEANKWKNGLILPAVAIDSLPHIIACWARNLVAGWALYFITGGLWGLWMYVINSSKYFPNPEDKPTWRDINLQISVSASAMIFYSLAPTIGEWLIERGFTHCYYDFAAVGGVVNYLGLLVAYMFFVEWGIYWVHRLLHDIAPLYKLLHETHHIYNNRNSLSPFAGLAFDPVDGLLQASPYVVGLLLLPVHFWTHEALLFFTGVWTTNIHDTLMGDTEPVMGSAYHTIHHTTYKNNYGQIFVLFDYLHDTLAPPPHRRKEWGWNTPTGRDYNMDYETGKLKSH